MSKKILEAIVVVSELTATTFSKEALLAIVRVLAQHEEAIVLKALEKCMKECRGRLTLADILDRIDQQNGWIGSDEAWAIANQALDESCTVVMNQFIGEAWAVARDSMPDRVAARMAFKSAYERIVEEAKDRGEKPIWFPSLGQDPTRREAALRVAADQGRIPHSQVQRLLPRPHIQAPEPLLLDNPGPKEKNRELAKAAYEKMMLRLTAQSDQSNARRGS